MQLCEGGGSATAGLDSALELLLLLVGILVAVEDVGVRPCRRHVFFFYL